MGVDVFYADRQLADVCASDKQMKRRFGPLRARRLQVRLQQLRVAETLADLQLVTSRIHALREDLAGYVAIDLDGPYRLLVEPVQPEGDDAETAQWSAVTQVIVHGIDDYH